MKIECILLSKKNYELAYKLREKLTKQNIELKLAKDIAEMFGSVTQNTKAIVIDENPKNSIKFSQLFSKNTGYHVVFICKEKIYDINGKLIFEEMDNFISSSIFIGTPKGYLLSETKFCVEKVFEKLEMIVVNHYGQLVKEILYYMLQNGIRKISKQQILLIAGKLNINQYHIYEKIALFLKSYYSVINAYGNFGLTKYDSKKLLSCLYILIEKEILSKNIVA